MEKTLILSVILLNGINLLKVCGSFITSASVYVIWEDNHSPDELKETSDLFCPELGLAFILNNSGKKTIIYNIDASGGIVSKNLIPTKNTERVSLTGDELFL